MNMSLTNADLLAISNLLDKKFDPLEQRLENLEHRFDGLENRFDGLENRFDGLENRFNGLENEVKGIKLQLEKNIIPRLVNIENCYVSTYERYQKSAEKVDRYIEKQELLLALVLEHEQKLKKLGV